MRPSEPVIDPVAHTVTVSLPMYIEMTGASYGNNGLADELDEYMMYIYKVKRCGRNRAHNWTECRFAHRGEKARRRDPRKFPYLGIACPSYRKSGECERGQNCQFSHGVFEYWLHPSRYRTRMCEAGLECPRKICFFAHTPQQLRSVAGNYGSEDEDDEEEPAAAVVVSPEPVHVPVPVHVAAPRDNRMSFFVHEPELPVGKAVQCHGFGSSNAAAARETAGRVVAMPPAATTTTLALPRMMAGSSSAIGERMMAGSSSAIGDQRMMARGKEVMRAEEHCDLPDFDWFKDFMN